MGRRLRFWQARVLAALGIRPQVTYAGRRIRVNLDTVIGRLLFIHGQFEEADIALCTRLLSPDSTVLDVGANIGLHTLRFAAAAPQGLVIAVEPAAETMAELLTNIAGEPHVVPLSVAVSDANGIAEFHVAEDNAYSGLKDTGRKEVRQIRKVAGFRLDDLLGSMDIGRLDLVKIDVEGLERQVLRGMAGLLARHRPFVFCEIYEGEDSNPDAAATVQDMIASGFEAFTSFDGTLRPFTGHDDRYFNYLFVPQEKRDRLCLVTPIPME